MNRVHMNEKDDSTFDLGCTSMMICGWKGGDDSKW